eukprot:m.32747 g.32747  ORF g.32747 m.32747 type:complete len:289 (-) comp16690_c0_seq1:84-950(-)
MSTAEHREPLLLTHVDEEEDDERPPGQIQDQPHPQMLFRPDLFDHPLQHVIHDEPPPSYQPAKWSNSRPLLSFLTEDDEEEAPPDPFANLSEGPRTVFMIRSDDGFGFTIGGANPVHVVQITNNGPAQSKGLKSGDQILEINGTDVLRANISEASTLIQRAETTLTMIVIPKAPPSATPENAWTAAIRALEQSNGQPVDLAIDPTQRPPDNLKASICSFFCCPFVGVGAIYHSCQVHRAWRRGSYTRARTHALMAKKLSGSAVVYGVIIIVFLIFVRIGKSQESDEPF